ncbi:hypothetical protein H5410_030053 [Solanum commersonii]|uniref:Uncharacterized protein n=1 Tax=Solanum commersonii TaxID=4109 RepID=A0A9J5YD66_SOLCO|nr:hypothetical protein H5410_030053 [Solanum commersonii]
MLRVLSSFIIWELWKRKNSIRHGKDISYRKLTYQFIRGGMIRSLSSCRPKLYYVKITWVLPLTDRLKIKTDRASRENHGRSSYTQVFQNTTSTKVEIKALEAMRYCQRANIHNVIIETDSLGNNNVI